MTMIEWGMSAMSHDAALAVMVDNEIVYASHGERYSRIKNDKNLHPAQIQEALEYGEPSRVHFYENTWLKKWRQLRAGQYNLLTKQSPQSYLKSLGIAASFKMHPHHTSHAAYALYTDPDRAPETDILVIDSIGESETLSIWKGGYFAHTADNLVKVWSQSYPHSVGLWYSAMTQRLGLKPQEHEYILMGMAALGDPNRYRQTLLDDFILKMPTTDDPSILFKQNLHRGCQWWRPEITSVQDYVDIAAAVQKIYEEIFVGLLAYMKTYSTAKRVAIVGGCALNCVANTLAYNFYDSVWVPPNPGDAGSAIGAILSGTRRRAPLLTPYLGTNIVGEYPIQAILNDLQQWGVAAGASGRAEYGPRALGHRSLLADPRLPDIKDRVNRIKHREEFRPFSPMVLSEHAANHFRLPDVNFSAPYMQYAIPCLHPQTFPGIVHIDDTSRVQTVSKAMPWEDRGPRRLLEAWHGITGCPMLLNTSLNIKGEPLVNTREDADRWTAQHGVTVRTAT